jgi:LytR cell envelope-related transcriptional attenuator
MRATVATRVSRGAAGRRRRATAAVVGVVAVAAGVYGLSRLGDAAGGGPTGSDPGSGSGAPSELLVLQVVGTDQPLLALVGTRVDDRLPSFFTVPFDLSLTVPGQGDIAAQEVASLDPEAVRVAVSNTFGAWAEHVAVLDLEGLAAVVDHEGDLRVHLPDLFVTDAGSLGPGPARLSGEQIAALLAMPEEGGGEARWAAVVQALLQRSLRFDEEDLAATNGLAGVRRVLHRSRGAAVATFPTTSVAGSVTVPLQPDLDVTVAQRFGVATPVPVIVQNGAGTPGLGEHVAARVLPLGFRIVLSQNADVFGYERTRIIANSDDALADARRIRGALGVGRVGVSQVPSGLGDITIIVGEDFTG